MRFKSFPCFLLISIFLFSCKKDCKNDASDTSSTLKEGLLLYLPFSGNLGDSSGNANNVTGFGTLSYNQNRYFEANKSVLFNGTDNRIEIQGQKFDTLTKFTMYMEFMPFNSNSMMLLSRTNFAVISNMKQAFSLMTNYEGAGTRFQLKKAGNCDNINTATAWGTEVLGQALPSINGWNYVAVTFDGTTIQTYLNGNLVATGTEPGASLCSGAPIIIGSWWENDPHYFNGRVDEVRMYNRVLSSSEISQIYQLHK